MLEVSVAYNRYRFIGDEFLTWLWFVVATNSYGPLFKEEGTETPAGDIRLSLGDRIVLKNSHDLGEETITITGSGADWQEGAVALRKGARVTELGLIFQLEENTWRATLKGESLHISGLKTPQGGKVFASEETEAAVLEKIYLYEQIFVWIDRLFDAFIHRRVSGTWEKEQVGAVRKWINDGSYFTRL